MHQSENKTDRDYTVVKHNANVDEMSNDNLQRSEDLQDDSESYNDMQDTQKADTSEEILDAEIMEYDMTREAPYLIKDPYGGIHRRRITI